MRFTAMSDNTITLEGHDFMATVSVPTSLRPGDRILVADVHPLAIVGSSRLGRIASAFETYLYSRYHATVITTADTATKGNYTLHFDKDSGDSLIPNTGAGFQAKEQAVAHDGIIKKAFENAELAMPRHNQQKEYYVQANGSDPRLTKQARFYILCSTAPSAAYDMDVWINWTCTLRLPAIDGPSESGAGVSTFYAPHSSSTAANPFGTAIPTAVPSSTQTGIGIGYNGTDSYVYCRQGSRSMAEFNMVTLMTGAATTTLTHAFSSNLAAVPGAYAANAGSGTTALLDVHTLRYNGTPTTVALTNAWYWDGSAWLVEPNLTVPVHWYVYFHLATFTTPSAASVQFIEMSNYYQSRNKLLLEYCGKAVAPERPSLTATAPPSPRYRLTDLGLAYLQERKESKQPYVLVGDDEDSPPIRPAPKSSKK
jgi:hypothetical protein